MPDPLSPVFRGQPISIAASAWNEILSAARDRRQNPRPDREATDRRQYGVVECFALNSTGADLAECKPIAVTAAGGATLTGADGFAWQDAPLLTLGVPAAVTDFVVVTLEAIPDGEIGRVAIAGAVLCDVQVTTGGEQYASPIAGSAAKLLAASSGTIRVLESPTTGSSVRCVVYVGDQMQATGGGESIIRVCVARDVDGCATGWRLTWYDAETGDTRCETVDDCPECDEVPAGCGAGGAGSLTTATESEDGYLKGVGGLATFLSPAQVTADLDPFVASGAGHLQGLVPDPGSTAGDGRFLCEDATWKTPHEIVFTPASGNTDLVALGAPVGTWTDVTGASWTVATAGTYEVWCEVSAGVNNTVAGADLRGRIVVNGTLSAGTETLPVYGATASASYIQHSSSNPVQLTLAVSDVVKLQVQRNGTGAWPLAICYSNANQKSGLFARRVG